MKNKFYSFSFLLKVIQCFFKSNALFNLDLFLSLIICEWIKFKKLDGSYPATIEDLRSGKSFDELQKDFHDNLDFIQNTLLEYFEKVHSANLETLDESKVYKALDLIKKYFFYLWV